MKLVLAKQRNQAMSIHQILGRGFTAAHGAVVGALFLLLLHAPVQILSGVAQGLQADAVSGPGQTPDVAKLVLSGALSLGVLVLTVAVFFLFPLVLGGILGQVRDRLQAPHQPPGPFGRYGRAFYPRLLGNLGVFTLVLVVVMLPVMCLWMGVAFQVAAEAVRAAPAVGDGPPQTLDVHQLTRQLLSNPLLLAATAVSVFLVSAAGMVYWVANSIVVAERQRVWASWGQALRFCGRHFGAVLVVWLLCFAVGVLMSPLSLVGPLGIVTDLWALALLGLLYAACISYWGVLLAGLVLSLYLARRPRPAAGQQEPGLAAVA
jgi:hypothetical protein